MNEVIVSFFRKGGLLFAGFFICYMQCSFILILITLGTLIWYEYSQKNSKIKFTSKVQTNSLSKDQIIKQIDNLPTWVLYPDRNRAEWLNETIKQLWPLLTNYIEKFFKGSIENKIRKKFKSFRFEDIDFGCNPPIIDGVKVYDRTTSKDSLIIDFDVYYDGNCNLNFSYSGAQIGRIKDFQLSVEMRVVLKPLLTKLPFIGGLQLFFLNTPDINFDLEGISGIPGLSYFIRTKIQERLFKTIVFPNKITKRFSKNVDAFELKSLEPEGVLRVHVAEAKNLERKDVTGTSDPYVILTIGAQEHQTPVVKKSVNPKWDYWCEFIVLDPKTQHLTFKLYDKDDWNDDDFLGSGEIDLKPIVKRKENDHWIKLEHTKHGEIYLRFTWLTLSSDCSQLDAALREIELLKVPQISAALLSIYLDSARKLPMVSPFKKPDPYIILTVGEAKQKSRIKRRTTDPVWQQGFTFFVRNPEIDALSLKLIDKQTDTAFGEINYEINRLTMQYEMEMSKTEFAIGQDEEESKLILSLQLRILNYEVPYKENGDDDDDDEESDSDTTDCEELSDRSGREVEQNLIKSTIASVERQKKITNVQSEDFLKKEYGLGRIELTISFSKPRQKLIITVHRLCGLPLKDSNEMPDPYVKLKLISPDNTTKYKTKCIKDSCDAVYEETFEHLLAINDLNKQKLIIIVKTLKKSFFNDNTIGQVSIDFKDIDLTQAYRAFSELTPIHAE